MASNPQERTVVQKVVVNYIDDIDGKSEAVYLGIKIAFEGRTVELDLSEKNYQVLSAALAPYLENGKTFTGPRPGTRKVRRIESDATTVKKWLMSHGYEGDIPQRGRIPKWLRERYEQKVTKGFESTSGGGEGRAQEDEPKTTTEKPSEAPQGADAGAQVMALKAPKPRPRRGTQPPKAEFSSTEEPPRTRRRPTTA